MDIELFNVDSIYYHSDCHMLYKITDRFKARCSVSEKTGRALTVTLTFLECKRKKTRPGLMKEDGGRQPHQK